MKESKSNGAFLWITCLGGILGGCFFAALAYHLGQEGFAKGLLLGALLSPPHFLGLRAMTARILNAGMVKGRGVFRFYYLLRWFSFLLVMGLLLTVSVQCLLGALISYSWSLLVLAWAGLRASKR